MVAADGVPACVRTASKMLIMAAALARAAVDDSFHNEDSLIEIHNYTGRVWDVDLFPELRPHVRVSAWIPRRKVDAFLREGVSTWRHLRGRSRGAGGEDVLSLTFRDLGWGNKLCAFCMGLTSAPRQAANQSCSFAPCVLYLDGVPNPTASNSSVYPSDLGHRRVANA